jgi:uncharacterized protein (DUF1015 family)
MTIIEQTRDALGEAEVAKLRTSVAVELIPLIDTMINLARQKMPRKSTWFTPKARAGLVVAQLDW